ncbi:DNA glycosylase AlkZ-like family protein [Leifsonia shinshuensis]|uniref:Winged helix-turn-helix domain-containing protein n=1 Tax=Leifsonia shinshuensis TaxID=150026 RepID=A0A7G6Y8R2_9MICO|nr:crosslink repair DNA glycosylase YcaQ family protein [Leifsonia shinshuensis]QNE34877.1 winged helix-turn-helix domain-containing protein [Leifsonia shinshuensis]
MAVTLDRDEARRIAVRAQRLDAGRPDGIVPLAESLTFLQLDPTAAIAPSADLIAYTRLGPAYRPETLVEALETDRLLYEVKAMDDPVTPPFAMVRPMSDLGLHLDRMSRWPERLSGAHAWLEANDAFRRDVLALLRDRGPTLSKDIPDTAAVPWESTGWTHNQNVTRLLELLQGRGEVAVAGRIGRQRAWDLGERVYPAGIAVVPEAEAARLRDERRLRSLGIARRALVGEAGEPATVEGSALEWRVDPAAVGLPFTGRTALLSPFDRLVHDRVRTNDLFGFEYLLEMYKPAAKRRWGYFALPILHGDRLIGKLDAAADRKSGVLHVTAIHEDGPLSPETRDAVRTEIDALAAWLTLTPEYPSPRGT